jgi:cell division protein FtsL
MAPVTTTLPKPRTRSPKPRSRPPGSGTRRPRNQPVAGRARFPRTYYVKRVDNSRLRREVDREKRRECYSLLGLSIVAFVIGLLYAWQHFDCVRYGYRIEQLKHQGAVLEESNRQLRLAQASLADPQRIDRLARHRLGLGPPSPQQVVLLEPVTSSAPRRPEFAANFPPLAPPVRPVFERGLGLRPRRR